MRNHVYGSQMIIIVRHFLMIEKAGMNIKTRFLISEKHLWLLVGSNNTLNTKA